MRVELSFLSPRVSHVKGAGYASRLPLKSLRAQCLSNHFRPSPLSLSLPLPYLLPPRALPLPFHPPPSHRPSSSRSHVLSTSPPPLPPPFCRPRLAAIVSSSFWSSLVFFVLVLSFSFGVLLRSTAVSSGVLWRAGDVRVCPPRLFFFWSVMERSFAATYYLLRLVYFLSQRLSQKGLCGAGRVGVCACVSPSCVFLFAFNRKMFCAANLVLWGGRYITIAFPRIDMVCSSSVNVGKLIVGMFNFDDVRRK